MIKIQSPFLQEIQECRVTMRKLRKKIYKHLIVFGPAKKSRDPNQNLLQILRSRNLPNFLLDPLKKRRSMDMSFLKNVIVSDRISTQQISQMTYNQENQIQQLFAEHRQRLGKTKKREDGVKFDKKSTNFSNEQGQSQQISLMSNLKNFNINQEEFQIQHANDHHSESHYNADDGLILNGPSFLSFHKDLDSGEEWLNF